jgi:hypothetical protein
MAKVSKGIFKPEYEPALLRLKAESEKLGMIGAY